MLMTTIWRARLSTRPTIKFSRRCARRSSAIWYKITMHRLVIAPLLTLLSLGATAQSAIQPTDWASYSGSAFDADTNKLVYTEVHQLALAADEVLERWVSYRCPNGRAFARKRVQRSRLPAVPSFALEDRRLDYSEGLEVGSDKVAVFVREAGNKATIREVLEDVPSNLVADAGFDVFVRDQWDALVAGETVRFEFLVPSRLDFLGFKVRQTGEDTIDGRAVRTFRLALGGVLGLVVSGIDVTYDAESRTLLRFSGLSNVRGPDGDNYVVRIDFSPAARKAEDGREALDAARTEELVSSCEA